MTISAERHSPGLKTLTKSHLDMVVKPVVSCGNGITDLVNLVGNKQYTKESVPSDAAEETVYLEFCAVIDNMDDMEETPVADAVVTQEHAETRIGVDGSDMTSEFAVSVPLKSDVPKEYSELMNDGMLDLDTHEINADGNSGCEVIFSDNSGCEVIVNDGVADLVLQSDLTNGKAADKSVSGISIDQMDDIFMNAMDEISKFNPCNNELSINENQNISWDEAESQKQQRDDAESQSQQQNTLTEVEGDQTETLRASQGLTVTDTSIEQNNSHEENDVVFDGKDAEDSETKIDESNTKRGDEINCIDNNQSKYTDFKPVKLERYPIEANSSDAPKDTSEISTNNMGEETCLGVSKSTPACETNKTDTEVGKTVDIISRTTEIYNIKQERSADSFHSETSPLKHNESRTDVKTEAKGSTEKVDQSENRKSSPPKKKVQRSRRFVPYDLLSHTNAPSVVIARNNIQNLTVHSDSLYQQLNPGDINGPLRMKLRNYIYHNQPPQYQTSAFHTRPQARVCNPNTQQAYSRLPSLVEQPVNYFQCQGIGNNLQAASQEIRPNLQNYGIGQRIQSTINEYGTGSSLQEARAGTQPYYTTDNRDDFLDQLLDGIVSSVDNFSQDYAGDQTANSGNQGHSQSCLGDNHSRTGMFQNTLECSDPSYVHQTSPSSQTYVGDGQSQGLMLGNQPSQRQYIGPCSYSTKAFTFHSQSSSQTSSQGQVCRIGQPPQMSGYPEGNREQKQRFSYSDPAGSHSWNQEPPAFPKSESQQPSQTMNMHVSCQNRNFLQPVQNANIPGAVQNLNFQQRFENVHGVQNTQNQSFQLPLQNVNRPQILESGNFRQPVPKVINMPSSVQGSDFGQPFQNINMQCTAQNSNFRQTVHNTKTFGSAWNTNYQQSLQNVNMSVSTQSGNCQQSLQNLNMLGSSPDPSVNPACQNRVQSSTPLFPASQINNPAPGAFCADSNQAQRGTGPTFWCHLCNRQFISQGKLNLHKLNGECRRSY